MTTTNGNGFHRGGAVMNREQFEAQLQTHVLNAMASRTEFFRRAVDPRRNLDDDCGYPTSGMLDAWFYRDLHDREPVAERVVSLMPKECWQSSPTVYEDEDPSVVTPFEESWDGLAKQLRGNSSYFQDEEGSPIWEYLYRADKLSGIGNFGVLLMGFDDGQPLYTPVEGVVSNTPVGNSYQVSLPRLSQEELDYAKRYENETKSKLTVNLATRVPNSLVENFKNASGPGMVMRDGQLYPLSSMGTDAQYFEPTVGPVEFPSVKPSTKKRSLMFLRPFDQSLVQVSQYESNMLNPRFGQPLMYRVTLNDPREYQNTGAGLSLATVQVHWSRVLHVADNLNASEVMGAPRMRPVLNPILDVRKVRGGSAEMFWKGAFPGIAISTHPQLGGDVPVDNDSMKDMMENWFNGLQRYGLFVGMDAKTLAPAISDPTPFINVLVEAICVQLGCPVRVFRGSERGELASTQDDSAWNDRLRHRQNNYVTPRIIVPFIDRLIAAGVLPTPRNKTSKQVVANARARGMAVRQLPNGHILVFNANGKPTDITSVNPRGGYSVHWPDLDSLGEKDKAAIFAQRMQGLGAYVSGGVDGLIAPKSMLVHFGEFDEEEAQAILDEQEQFQEDEMAKHGDLADMAEPHDLVPTPPTGFEAKPEPPPALPGMPGGPPVPPVKMGAGEALVHPQTGKTVAKTPFPPKPPTKNEEVENAFCPTGEGGGVDPSCSPTQKDWLDRVDRNVRYGVGEGGIPRPTAEAMIKKGLLRSEHERVRGTLMEWVYVTDKGKEVITKNEEYPVVFDDGELVGDLHLTENCGGPGSGVPGPCPSGVDHREVHLETLKAISDEFTKGSGGREEVMARVDQVLKDLSKEQLKAAAEKFGSRSAKGRKERVEGIKRFISDRREMYQRTLRNKEVSDGEHSNVSQEAGQGGEGELPPQVREEV